MIAHVEDALDIAAQKAAAEFKDASADTKAAYMRAIANELGMSMTMEVPPQTQAGLLDAIHQNVGGKTLLQRATFARGVIAVLDMDARMIVSGEKRRTGLGITDTNVTPSR